MARPSSSIFPNRPGVVAFLAALLLPIPLLAAGDPEFIGPVRVRDLRPISMLRLDFVPTHASDDASLSVLRVNHSEANVFMVSDAAENYLESRRQKGALTAADVGALMKGKSDFFVFDAELAITDLEYIRALSERTQLRIEWPLLSRGGGFLTLPHRFRTYADAGYGINLGPQNRPIRLQTGLEFEDRPRLGSSRFYAAVDATSFQENRYQLSTNLQTGLLFQSAGSPRKYRFGIELYRGRAQLDNFFLDHERYAIVGMWLDL